MNYQIRVVEEKDLDELVELCAAHAAYEQCDYDKEGKKEALGSSLCKVDSDLKCLVVEVEAGLVGYATFIRQYSTWDAGYYLYMDCLYLKEECRGAGIGKKLLDLIKLQAVDLECFQVQWQTPVNNEKAIKFYQREGAGTKNKVRFFFEF